MWLGSVVAEKAYGRLEEFRAKRTRTLHGHVVGAPLLSHGPSVSGQAAGCSYSKAMKTLLSS